MDIAEREAFFARGGGSNPPARGPPPMMPPARTPSDAGDWGPSPESQQMSRDRLARQRQAEYNEYLAQRQAHDAAHAASVRPNHLGPPNDAAGPRGGGSLRDHPTPAASDASPGLVFDEEQRPRPKGGLRDIHRSADAERLSRAAERKRRYAAELQQQMAERQRREQMEKSENRRADLATVGMGNVIRDMHDGRLDGVDENGVALGYDYGQVHAPPGARPYHPAPPTDPHGDHQPHGGHGAEETPTDPRRHHPPDSGRFGGGAMRILSSVTLVTTPTAMSHAEIRQAMHDMDEDSDEVRLCSLAFALVELAVLTLSHVTGLPGCRVPRRGKWLDVPHPMPLSRSRLLCVL